MDRKLGLNKKEIRNCSICKKKENDMMYVRERNSPFWFYRCLSHAPLDKQKYAMVEIDNRP